MPGMLAHTCNPSTLEAEGGPGIQGHIALQCKTLPPTTNFFFKAFHESHQKGSRTAAFYNFIWKPWHSKQPKSSTSLSCSSD